MSPVSERLVRLLNMVPYFQANPRITYAEAASDLGVTEKQLRDDLNQLWMCGLPGYGPGDLIDFEFSGDTIEVTFSAGIDHPLRLTSPEATGVLSRCARWSTCPAWSTRRRRAARSRRSSPQRARSPTGTRRRRRTGAGGEPGRRRGAGGCARQPGADHRVLLGLPRHADQQNRRPDPRGSGRREQLPGSLVPVGGGRSAVPVRPNRRRIRARRAVGAAGARRAAPPDTSLFDADPSLPSATLLIDRSASWMFDYYPLRVTRELPDGACEAAMTYASDEWMARFVLGFGSGVRVLAPESLAQRVRESAAAALRAYGVGVEAGG